jgi:hypothetical protein
MAKIPQGEWNAIAARYSKGESLSSIARHYGCTPPAIHYLLKRRNRLNAPADAGGLSPTQPAVDTAPDGRHAGQSATQITTMKDTMGDVQPFSSRQPRIEKHEPPRALAARPEQNGPRAPEAAPKSPGAGRTPALTVGLDAALQAHAEAAIQAFRSSFSAALGEGSPANHERLRQAASDLMRAAARTTIVLDRVDASDKRRG